MEKIMPYAPAICYPELRSFPAALVAVPPGALPFSGLTALLVEDSRLASESLRLLWRRGGGRLRRAETMAQARLHWRTYIPDVVIVDLGLPDGRGEDLIRDFNAAGRKVLILGLSGDPDGRVTALAAGARGFLDKADLSMALLERLVARHLGRSDEIEDEPDFALPLADPLCLQEDLIQLRHLLRAEAGPQHCAYVAGFLIGMARSMGDAGLLHQAQALAEQPAERAATLAMIEARLAAFAPSGKAFSV